jgi:hypothetical protein
MWHNRVPMFLHCLCFLLCNPASGIPRVAPFRKSRDRLEFIYSIMPISFSYHGFINS